MFAFSNHDPRTAGVVANPQIPLNRYLGAAWDQGQEDSMWESLHRINEYWNADNGELLSTTEANRRYGFPGMSFDRPIDDGRARLVSERRRSEADRSYLLHQGGTGWRGVMGFGATMVGNMSSPLDFAAMFIPFVGEERLAKAGTSALRKSLSSGLLASREGIARFGLPFPAFQASVLQGVGFQATAEIPLMISKMQEPNSGYDFGKYLTDVALGGIFAGGIHAGLAGAGRLLGLVERSTREAMFRKALNDALDGRAPEVRDIVRTDPAVVREAVKFDEAKARSEALASISLEEVKAKVKLEGGEVVTDAAIKYSDGTIKTGTRHAVIDRDLEQRKAIGTDADPLWHDPGAIEGFVTNKGRFLTRMEAAKMMDLPDSFGTHLDLPLNAEYGNLTPQERSFVEFMMGDGADEETAMDEVTKWRRRTADAAYFAQPEIQAKVEAEHAKRVDEFVARKRAEFDRENPAPAPAPREEVEKSTYSPGDPTKDLPTLEEANKMLEEELGIDVAGSEKSPGGDETSSPAQSTFDKIDQVLESLKIKTGTHLEGVTSLPVWLWNGAIEAVRLAVKGGKAIADAIEEGVSHIRENWGRHEEVLKSTEGKTQVKIADLPKDVQKEAKSRPKGMSLRTFLGLMSKGTGAVVGGVPGKILEVAMRPGAAVKKLMLPKITLEDLANMGADAFNESFEMGTATHPNQLPADHPLADFLPSGDFAPAVRSILENTPEYKQTLKDYPHMDPDIALDTLIEDGLVDTPLSELQAQGKIPEGMVEELYGKIKAVANWQWNTLLEEKRLHYADNEKYPDMHPLYQERNAIHDTNRDLRYEAGHWKGSAQENPEAPLWQMADKLDHQNVPLPPERLLSTEELNQWKESLLEDGVSKEEVDRLVKEKIKKQQSPLDAAIAEFREQVTKKTESVEDPEAVMLQEQVKSIEEVHAAHIDAIDEALRCMLRRIV